MLTFNSSFELPSGTIFPARIAMAGQLDGFALHVTAYASEDTWHVHAACNDEHGGTADVGMPTRWDVPMSDVQQVIAETYAELEQIVSLKMFLSPHLVEAA